jgi:hypothetical protein
MAAVEGDRVHHEAVLLAHQRLRVGIAVRLNQRRLPLDLMQESHRVAPASCLVRAALLRCTLTDQIADYSQPSGDAEPHSQIFARRQPTDCFDHREGDAHRPLGVVLRRLRISK